jgi:hypothetical protein
MCIVTLEAGAGGRGVTPVACGDSIWYHGMQPEQRCEAIRLLRVTLNHVYRFSSSLCPTFPPSVAELTLPTQACSPAAEDYPRFVYQNNRLTLDDDKI